MVLTVLSAFYLLINEMTLVDTSATNSTEFLILGISMCDSSSSGAINKQKPSCLSISSANKVPQILDANLIAHHVLIQAYALELWI